MEYQKIESFLENASNQPSKFRTKNWVEINDESRGTYSVNRQINFKISILRYSLCDYSDAYILVKGNISVNNTAGAPFTDCISKLNNTQGDNAKDIDIVMPMYILI